MKLTLIATAATMLLLTSCARKVKVTTELKNKLDEQRVNLKQIQFYNRGVFHLERNLTSEAVVASQGKIRMKNGRQVEVLKFKNSTPAICDSVKDQTIFVRFEKGGNRVLAFKPNITGNYQLCTLPPQSGSPIQVAYGNEIYELGDFGGAVLLTAKRKKVREADIHKRKVKGVKVN